MQGAGDHAERTRAVGDPCRRRGLGGHGRIPARGRKIEDVKQVEHLHSELRRDSFRNIRVLDNREIYGLEARPFELIAASVAESAWSIAGKRGRIDPLNAID